MIDLVMDEVLPPDETSHFKFGFTSDEWPRDPSVRQMTANLDHGDLVYDPSLGTARPATADEKRGEPHVIGRVAEPRVESIVDKEGVRRAVGSGKILLRQDGDPTADWCYAEAKAGRLQYGSIFYRQALDEATGRTVGKQAVHVALTPRPRKSFCVVKRVHSEGAAEGGPTGTVVERLIAGRVRAVMPPPVRSTKAFPRAARPTRSAMSAAAAPAPTPTASSTAAAPAASPAPAAAVKQEQHQQQQQAPAQTMELDNPEFLASISPEELGKKLSALSPQELVQATLKLSLLAKETVPVALKARQEAEAAAAAKMESNRKFLVDNADLIRDAMDVDVANEQSKPFVDFLVQEGDGEQFYSIIASATKHLLDARSRQKELETTLAQAQGRLAEYERAAKRQQRIPEVPRKAASQQASHISLANEASKGADSQVEAAVAQQQALVKAMADARKPPAGTMTGGQMTLFKGGNFPRAAAPPALRQVAVQQNDSEGASAPQTGDVTLEGGGGFADPRIATYVRCVRNDGFYLPSGHKVDLNVTGRNMSSKSWNYLQAQIECATATALAPEVASMPPPPTGTNKRRDA